MEMTNFIEFNHVSDDKRYYNNLDSDYDKVLKDQREAKNPGSLINQELSQQLRLRLSLAFLSNIANNELTLRLDQALVVRQNQYFHKMVQANVESEVDPSYRQEMI